MRKFLIYFAFSAVSGLLFAAPAAEKPGCPPRPPRHGQPGRPQGNPGRPQSSQGNNVNFWRVFSRLTPEEQKEMMTLQRTDPEKFRTAIQEKAEKIQREQQARRQKIDELASKIRNCKDEKVKAELRNELRSMFKRVFDARLAQMRHNLEDNKKRIERMEADLKKREENAEAIVDAITDSVISGKKRPPYPGERKMPRQRP